MKSMSFMSMILFHFLILPTLAIPKIVTRLIHYQSVHSPTVFRSNSSDLEISIARMKQLKSRMTLGKLSQSSFDTGIFSKEAIPLFLVEFSVGRSIYGGTGFSQIVPIDTGSSLLWVRCYPNSDGAFYKRYVPVLSSTFSRTDCKLCEFPLGCGEGPSYCFYSQQYSDETISRGYLASEIFSFNSTLYNVKGIDILNITFGCALKVSKFNMKLNGILGLGKTKFSLLSQMHVSEFSYCIGNVQNTSSIGNVLMLGPNEDYNDFVLVEYSTPFSSEGRHYHVNLTGISFGGTMLDIDKEELSLGNTLFDLGSSISALQPIAYKNLYDEICNWMEQETSLKQIYSRLPELCYQGKEKEIKEVLDYFPLVSFHFDGGAKLDLDGYNIFRRVGDFLVCLNLMNAQDKLGETFPNNLIGVYLQQYHYMKYDLENRRMYIASVDCENLVTSME